MINYTYSYEDFADYIRYNINKYLPSPFSQYTAEIIQVPTERGKRTALTINPNNADSNMVLPIIYLESAYNEYLTGANLESILRKVALDVSRSWPDKDLIYGIGPLDVDHLKEKVKLRIMDYRTDPKLLDQILYYKVYVTFYFDFSVGTATVSRTLGEELGTMEEIKEIAWNNMQGNEYIATLEDVVKEIQEEEEMDEDQTEDFPFPVPYYVITNKDRSFGAIFALNYDILDRLAEEYESDLIIIPTSVHEVIVAPQSIENERMLYSIFSVLSGEDAFSKHMFRYYYEEKKLMVL